MNEKAHRADVERRVAEYFAPVERIIDDNHRWFVKSLLTIWAVAGVCTLGFFAFMKYFVLG